MVEYVIGEGVEEVPPAEEPPAEEETPTPGFEALFAISGLLAVAYFVLRKK
ncbi:MAG: PGF-CTERM sorting domain-containing protein [Methanosarcinales archaeon]|uniref:PGF-CTERM sorting domain-containing protein n=1 Tax=Candidatus Ethanoperedens thermophilum TaxID=2766897 RepID=A0A848D9J8_9EURY|nr:PGF-CTERM sorting domain-containing protein [Candidatus Ethanoperedens thermophilum]